MDCIHRYGYSHYLHERVFAPRGVKWLWQDVICQYWNWAQSKTALFPGSKAMEMKPALSVMHAKAHSWHCQVTNDMHKQHLVHTHTQVHARTTYTTHHQIVHLPYMCVSMTRSFGEVDGRMVLEGVPEKTWSNFSHIFHAGAQHQSICSQKVQYFFIYF